MFLCNELYLLPVHVGKKFIIPQIKIVVDIIELHVISSVQQKASDSRIKLSFPIKNQTELQHEHFPE